MTQAKTISIKCASRASVKIKDSFYTVEWCEERSVPEDANLEVERESLWETCNSEVDNQIRELLS